MTISGSNLAVDVQDLVNVTIAGSAASIINASPSEVIIKTSQAKSKGVGDIVLFSTVYGYSSLLSNYTYHGSGNVDY